MDYFAGFNIEWAEDGQAFDWSEQQYKQGWSVIGDSKPSVEQFNGVHQVVDQKANWLFRQFAHAANADNISIGKSDEDVLTRLLNRKLEALYPVGSVYINAANSSNPGAFLPGVWEKMTDGFLYPHGADGAGSMGSTGGERTVRLTEGQIPAHKHDASVNSAGGHTHTGNTSQSGGHQHRYRDDYYIETANQWRGNTLGSIENLGQNYRGTDGTDSNNNSLWYQMRDTEVAGTHGHSFTTNQAGAHTHGVTIEETGGGGSHNNMPPYAVVSMWKRVS